MTQRMWTELLKFSLYVAVPVSAFVFFSDPDRVAWAKQVIVAIYLVRVQMFFVTFTFNYNYIALPAFGVICLLKMQNNNSNYYNVVFSVKNTSRRSSIAKRIFKNG